MDVAAASAAAVIAAAERAGKGTMPGRGRTTYNKRLKEQKRAEKRQEKEARRQLRKLGTQTSADQNDEQTPSTDLTDHPSEQNE